MSPSDDTAAHPPRGRRSADGVGLADAVRSAVEQFTALTGREAESVTGARRSRDGGWSVLVDVLEMERVPSTTSVMATYRVETDSHGTLTAYERLRRYNRGATDPS